MSKFWVILKREYTQVVKKKSFLIMIFLTPVLMGGFMILPALLVQKEASSSEMLAVIDRGELEIGDQFAESLSRYTLESSGEPSYAVTEVFRITPDDENRFQNVYDSLTLEIRDKNLKYILVVKPDAHLADSNLYLVTNANDFIAINRFEARLSRILSTHRLKQSDINLPIDSVLLLTQNVDLAMKDTKGLAIPFQVKYFGALIFVMIMYMMIITYGATLMRSVIEEKSSRIIEVLISSVTPFQLMFGKIIGLGLAAFTQVAVWVVIGLVLFFASNSAAIEVDPAISRIAFNPVIVAFFVLYFVAGYVLYSALFALIGSIVNSDKEAQNFIFPITITLILPVMVGIGVVKDPYATWVLVMSYIPFITPSMMLMRIIFLAPTATEYSFFSGILAEATLGFLVVVAATFFTVWVTAKIFRVGILMYGKRPTLPEIIRWVRY
jgi:ABC-2 type transport system permease protein